MLYLEFRVFVVLIDSLPLVMNVLVSFPFEYFDVIVSADDLDRCDRRTCHYSCGVDGFAWF